MTDRVDSVNADHLAAFTTGGLDLDAAPGLFGNGVHLDALNYFGGIHQVYLANNVGFTPVFAGACGNNGFSVAGWANIISDAAGGVPAVVIFIFNGAVQRFNLGITLHNGGIISMDWTDAAAVFGFTGGIPWPIGVWFFYHFFYDASLQQVGYSINNGAETTFGAGLLCGVHDGYCFEVTQSGHAVFGESIQDEILVKMDAKLKPSQVTYLFNGGVGRTWPIALPP